MVLNSQNMVNDNNDYQMNVKPLKKNTENSLSYDKNPDDHRSNSENISNQNINQSANNSSSA